VNISCREIGKILIRSWAYQLQRIDPDVIARSSSDVIIIDYSKDGTGRGAFKPQVVADMKRKQDGTRRLLLAYLSIGEAESYRFYWRSTWQKNPPNWLGRENPNWPGNYNVRFWEKDWQDHIFAPPDSYLDKIIAAGFDGVYLDRVDAFQFWGDHHPQAMVDMVEFVESISAYAKLRNNRFVVVAQNGEELLEFPRFRRAIDAMAKEDLFFGIRGDGVANTHEQVSSSLRFLQLAQRDNRPVLVVEYLSDELTRQAAERQFETYGLIGTFAPRHLDRLVDGPLYGKAGNVKMPGSGLCDS
jgi:cysteinyl-tRNA synthetase